MSETPTPAYRHLRISLSIAALAASVAATVGVALAADDVAALREARERWQDVGFLLISWYAFAVPVGTLALSPWARRVGRSARLGWRNAGLVLGHGVLVAALAWFFGDIVADYFSGNRGGGSKGAYLTWLIATLPAFAAVALAGGLFPRPAAPRTHGVVAGVAAVSWICGALPFLFLIVYAFAEFA
ncbi:hypothetical protein HDA40_001540 [Hamadaea flava]|uniref:Uncharacterized protein n=1 Tax=Hamadaea flava TaxID=1742688 RepID=A0ABV8LPJ2_9ACTN|nr:hypothetical protein [Hamadaea flava]MCP2323033.1 hypothetical protein [Hamadaea flava]